MKWLKRLGSLKVTLRLLAAIAFLSLAGMIVVQGKDAETYRRLYGEFCAALIMAAGADNVFDGFAFFALVVLLFVNLLICVLRSVKFLFSRKLRRTALFFVHAGVLLIISGAALSKWTRWEQEVRLLPEEKLVLAEAQAEVVFRNFTVEYYPDGNIPRDYRSEVSLFERGRRLGNRIIRVNQPLKFKGYQLFQAAFEPAARVEARIYHGTEAVWEGTWLPGMIVTLPESGITCEIIRFVPDAVLTADDEVEQVSFRLRNAALLIRIDEPGRQTRQEWVFADPAISENSGNGRPLPVFEIREITPLFITRLQIVRDRGVPLVWTGFALLSAGLAVVLPLAGKKQEKDYV